MTESISRLHRLAFAALLAFAAACAPCFAQNDVLLERAVTTETKTGNRVETGFLTSGADAEDLDRGVFVWDYLAHTTYYYQMNDRDNLRLRYQYWDFLNHNRRNFTSLRWRRQLSPTNAYWILGDYTDEEKGSRNGNLCFGYQDLLKPDLQWAAQLGAGYDHQHDVNTTLFLEVLKPLTVSTLLRASNDVCLASSGYRSETFRLHLIQALHKRLAMNLGYRFFGDHQISDDVDDVVSHEGSCALVFQALDNVFLTTRYGRYLNESHVQADSISLGAIWRVTKRVSTTAGYRLQRFHGGPTDHGFRVGVSVDF